MTVALENISENNSENTSVTFVPPAGLVFGEIDPRCTEDISDQLVCNIGLLEAESIQAVSVDLHAELPGFYPVTVSFAADNLADGSFTSTYFFEVVEVEGDC